MREEDAIQMFNSGFNCAQSVMYAYKDEMPEDENSFLRLAAGMGGGVASRGELCGAVNGAVMVLGNRLGHDLKQSANKEQMNREINAFMDAFTQKHGSVICRKLLGGADLQTPEGQMAMKEKLKVEVCSQCVRTAVNLIENKTQK